jgi:hypothetical protein
VSFSSLPNIIWIYRISSSPGQGCPFVGNIYDLAGNWKVLNASVEAVDTLIISFDYPGIDFSDLHVQEILGATVIVGCTEKNGSK